jgi:excisionase family DNA binding protein
MQLALIIPESEWKALLADVEQLKREAAATKATASLPQPDHLLTVRQAAAYLSITPEGIRKARRAGRIAGLRLNEKEWGFRESELDRYLNRYNRRQLPPTLKIP